jgi:hypothetical protein
MNRALFALIFTAGLMIRPVAMASPTILINTPSAIGLQKGSLRLGAKMSMTVDKRYSDSAAPTPQTELGFIVGAVDNGTLSVETGLSWVEPVAQDNLNALRGNVKFAVQEESAGGVGFALGAFDYGFKANAGSHNLIYGLLSRNLGASWGRAQAGYFSGCPDTLQDETRNPSQKGFMAGWERALSEWHSALTAVIEWMGSNSIRGQLSLGFRWIPKEAATFTIGYNIPNNRQLARDSVTAQLSVEF